MSEASYRFCEVALPVPSIKRSRRDSAGHASPFAAGCRVLVPFGARSLTGVALAVRNEAFRMLAKYAPAR